jgi:hypothetical protein
MLYKRGPLHFPSLFQSETAAMVFGICLQGPSFLGVAASFDVSFRS